MDEQWEHTANDTIKCSIVSNERINNFGNLPYIIQHELRVLSYPPNPDSVSANAFDNLHRLLRSDGVTTFMADEHGDKDIYFCDFKDGAVLAHAAIQPPSLVKIFVYPQHRHHYEAAHLLIAIDETLREKGKHLDSGTLTERSTKRGWRSPQSYEIAHAVWKKLVASGLAEPVPGQNGDGPSNRFRFKDKEET